MKGGDCGDNQELERRACWEGTLATFQLGEGVQGEEWRRLSCGREERAARQER